MNTTIFTGRLTKDPELKNTNSGKAVCSFDIAVDKGFGEQKKAIFPTLIAWEKTAEYLCKYGAKGATVVARCEFDIREYTDKDGGKRKAYEFTVRELQLVGKGKEQTSGAEYQAGGAGFEDLSNDDELPF